MRRALVGALSVSLLLTACKGEPPRSTTSSSTSRVAATKPVRIGVWQSPDPKSNTYGGIAVRALVYAQLFRVTPEGDWEPSIVEPGSDKTGPGATSARFRLRRNARWTDGTRISVRDLRRTMDARFVKSVAAPTASGTVVVHFTQRLPGWRRLWSGLDIIGPPAEGVFGGPYRVDHVTTGFETVLTANRRYFAPPTIGEVHFVLVPDSEVAARLMERGELDVLAPPAYTTRTARLKRIKNAHVDVGSSRGGWTAALVTNPTRLTKEDRVALFGLLDRKRFVDAVLHDEAAAQGLSTASEKTPRFAHGAPAIAAPVEAPPVGLLLHAMQRLAYKRGSPIELRQDEFDQVLGAFARSDFDAIVRLQPNSPSPCWTCEAGTVDAALAADADAGKPHAVEKLLRKLQAEAIVLPLWRERPVVVWRDGLEGVSANGFSVLGPAWDLPSWRWRT